MTLVDNDDPVVWIEVESSFSESVAERGARLEDVGRRLGPESFYNGDDGAGGFVSDGLQFNNEYNSTFGSWSGWSYSNVTDTATAGFANQYSAYANLPSGGGATASDTYAVGNAFEGALVPSIIRDPSTTGSFQSVEITNSTYAALSMLTGDSFAKRFGGESGDDEDFFLLTIEGVDETGSSVGTVDFFLADFRFADNSLDYIVMDWTVVDVSELAAAVELRFSLSSSDVGSFGMNTPAYFALDHVVVASSETSGSPPQATLKRNSADTSADLSVTLSSSDRSELRVPTTVTIPAGESSVNVPLRIQADSLVDGDQEVLLEASASSHLPSTTPVTIIDVDTRALTLTIIPPELSEENVEGSVVVHRNVDDTTQPLDVQLAADPEGQLALEQVVTIPAGSRRP